MFHIRRRDAVTTALHRVKLESSRGPVEVIVIDRLEKPTFD